MVAYRALRCAILLACLCRLGASLLYSGGPNNRVSEHDKFPWPEDRIQCNETGWRLLDNGELREQYEDMIVRMQGKHFLFAGDSLMDMIFHPLLCGAVATGWNIQAMHVGEWTSRAKDSAGCVAKMLKKKDHKPIVMSFMRFYNYEVGEGSVTLDDAFHFPILGGFQNFDVLFMNMAHNAMFDQTKKSIKALAKQLIDRAQKATNIGRVVFLGHPPQHFKTESGAYAGPESGPGCMCHDKAAMERQPMFAHNHIVEKEVRNHNTRSDAGGKIAFASPWDFYADKCDIHGHGGKLQVDCTHWLAVEVATHAPFLKQLVATAGL